MPHRPERIAETIREELAELVAGELADPRIGLATVTEVKLESQNRVALVYVAVSGGEAEQERSLEGLIAARGFLRAELARRMQARRIPELRFAIDRQEQLGARLDTLFGRSRKRTMDHG